MLAGGIHLSFQAGSLPVISASSAESNRPTQQESIQTSSTLPEVQVLLGVSAPKGDRDQVYKLFLPQKTLQTQEMDKGWRVDTWKRFDSLRIVPASPDGKAPMLMDGNEWNVSLRGANGEAYLEPSLIGVADATHAFVLATTDARKILLVSRAGEIRVLADVPEYANALASKDGHAWFATYTPGEGIESEPIGPSRLMRVSLSGAKENISEETRVIVDVLPGQGDAVAYRTDDGDAVVLANGRRWAGTGIPLAWLSPDALLLSQGRNVFLLDMRSVTLELLQQLPAVPSAADVL